LNSLINCSSLPVTVSGHASLKVCKGVISCFDLLNAPVEQIKKNMKRYKVVEVKQILSRKSGSLEPTPALIVSFALPSLQVEVKCAYYNMKVRLYIPNPMRCFKCQCYGHTQSCCTKPTTCPDCGLKEHESTQCEREHYGVNCNGDHSARFWQCPMWKREQAVMELSVTSKITPFEARRRLKPPSPYYPLSVFHLLL
jgi:Zn finger protein HypA/HybF involved in hydrogenase expression